MISVGDVIRPRMMSMYATHWIRTIISIDVEVNEVSFDTAVTMLCRDGTITKVFYHMGESLDDEWEVVQ